MEKIHHDKKIIEMSSAPILFLIYQALFTTPLPEFFAWAGKRYPIQFLGGHQGKLPSLNFGSTRVVVQNPAKQSKWAYMAQQGHKICWAISLTGTPTRWIGQVIDGHIHRHIKVNNIWQWYEITWPSHTSLYNPFKVNGITMEREIKQLSIPLPPTPTLKRPA